MRVLLLNQYYHPDIAATAQLCADLAEDLARRGHRVTAVAGTAAYRTAHDGERVLRPPRLPLRETHRGVRVLRVPVASPRLLGDLGARAVGYGTFLSGALLTVIADERPDVVLALSTPPLVAALGLCLKALRGCRFVYWVQDVYPDLAVRLGVMRPGGAAARGFSALSRLLYRRADAVVAIDDAMAERLRSEGAGCVRVIDNWCDGEEVTPQAPEDNALRRRLRLDGAFVVGYAGNLGRGHDFETVTAAMGRLAGEPSHPVHWLFIGGGPRRALVEAAARGLPSARLLPPQARGGLRDVLTAGDVGLVTLEEGMEGLLVPSKVYGLLAAGRPVLYVGPGRGRVAELVEQEGLGESVRNGDVEGLCAAVRRLGADPVRRARMGARARAVFERRYSRQRATALHEAVLAEVLCRPGGGRP